MSSLSFKNKKPHLSFEKWGYHSSIDTPWLKGCQQENLVTLLNISYLFIFKKSINFNQLFFDYGLNSFDFFKIEF